MDPPASGGPHNFPGPNRQPVPVRTGPPAIFPGPDRGRVASRDRGGPGVRARHPAPGRHARAIPVASVAGVQGLPVPRADGAGNVLRCPCARGEPGCPAAAPDGRCRSVAGSGIPYPVAGGRGGCFPCAAGRDGSGPDGGALAPEAGRPPACRGGRYGSSGLRDAAGSSPKAAGAPMRAAGPLAAIPPMMAHIACPAPRTSHGNHAPSGHNDRWPSQRVRKKSSAGCPSGHTYRAATPGRRRAATTPGHGAGPYARCRGKKATRRKDRRRRYSPHTSRGRGRSRRNSGIRGPRSSRPAIRRRQAAAPAAATTDGKRERAWVESACERVNRG